MAAPSPSRSWPRSNPDWNPNRGCHCWSNDWKRKMIAWERHRCRNSHIRKNQIIAIAAGLVIVAYSGWWWLTARTLTGRIDQWIAGEQAKGAKITPMAVLVGGYPFAFS